MLGVLAATILVSSASTLEFDFRTSERTWIGPDFWANPLEDWRVANDSAECINPAANRNLALLTAETASGNWAVSTEFVMRDVAFGPENGFVGFAIGRQGQFNDFRDTAIYGSGLRVGIDHTGSLVIGGTPAESSPLGYSLVNKPIRLTVERQGERIIATASADGKSQTISRAVENPEGLSGGLALVSDLPQAQKNGNSARVSFENLSLSGLGIDYQPNRSFGSILFTQFTVSEDTLKLTAQLAPISDADAQTATLEIRKSGEGWRLAETSPIDPLSRTATFRVENWDPDRTVFYRVRHKYRDDHDYLVNSEYRGHVKPEPKGQLNIGVLTCFYENGYPAQDLAASLAKAEPDLLFFSGDQLYEPNGGYSYAMSPDERAMLTYLRKWYMWGWAFRDLTARIPTVTTPDDHDVLHGNLWGAGGKIADTEGGKAARQDSGGYVLTPRVVNAIERTQTSHLPDPVDPEPTLSGIGVYFTRLIYGKADIAIVEDRKFKSAPKVVLPEADIWNGFARNPDFDFVHDSDVPEAELLGPRQEAFLAKWAKDKRANAPHKFLLSQSIYNCLQTLPEGAQNDQVVPNLPILAPGEYPPNDAPVSDLDSNSWPQSKRNRVVQYLREANAMHLSGDQHLASVFRYDVDGPWAFCTPSISNIWPRRWMPLEPGKNRTPSMPRYAGDFVDGFGNSMRVYAVANPRKTGLEPWSIYDKATGYGVVKLLPNGEKIIECWPRWVKDPTAAGAKQYEGWPLRISPSGQLIEPVRRVKRP